jgi:hypothetical protein
VKIRHGRAAVTGRSCASISIFNRRFDGSHWRTRAGKVLKTPLSRNLKSEDLPKRRVSVWTPPSVPGWSAFRTGRELPEDP